MRPRLPAKDYLQDSAEYTDATHSRAAVSVRRRDGPRDSGTKPDSSATEISSEEKSPSGPIRKVASRHDLTKSRASARLTLVLRPETMSLSQ